MLRGQFHLHSDAPLRSFGFHLFLEGGVHVPEQPSPFVELADLPAPDSVAAADIPSEADNLASATGDEGKAVSVGKSDAPVFQPYRDRHISRSLPAAVHRSDRNDSADFLAHRLRSIHGGPGTSFPVQEQLGVSPVESLFRIRDKTACHLAEGCPPVAVGMRLHEHVQRL